MPEWSTSAAAIDRLALPIESSAGLGCAVLASGLGRKAQTPRMAVGAGGAERWLVAVLVLGLFDSLCVAFVVLTGAQDHHHDLGDAGFAYDGFGPHRDQKEERAILHPLWL